MRVMIDKANNCLVTNGKPFFYLSDTAWMAFQKLSLLEYQEYLHFRRVQRFSVMQFSVLPISHDTSNSADDLEPFALRADGTRDFFSYNTEYFDKAEEIIRMTVEAGLVPCLHLLWVNYIPDTWGAERSPDTVMPFAAVEPFLTYVLGRYAKYKPLYSISGDTKFETEQVVDYYVHALAVVKRLDPEGLTTLHLNPEGFPPKRLMNDENYDFYTYQSSHGRDNQDLTYKHAKYYHTQEIRRPVINTEPCYEGHGHGFVYGRFSQFEVRRATWHSLLAGAKAGIGYGAHGVWSFHKRGDSFTSVEFSNVPYDWRTSLRFLGAWDVSYARFLFEEYGLFAIEPLPCPIENKPEIRLAGTEDDSLYALYLPYANEVPLPFDPSKYDCILIDLESRNVSQPSFRIGELPVLEVHDFNADTLLIAKVK